MVVTNSLAPSHQSSAKGKPLAATEQAASFKHNKYKELAEFQNAKFIPFACEALGGLSKDAKRVVNLLASLTVSNCPWLSRDEVKNDIQNHIAIIIQRGNAAMIREGEMRRLKFA